MAVNLLKKNSLALVASLLLAGHVQATELLNSSYDVSRELFAALNPPFEQQWAKDNGGDKLTIKQSHAGSSKQALAILQGLKADVVTYNQVTDVQILHDKGIHTAFGKSISQSNKRTILLKRSTRYSNNRKTIAVQSVIYTIRTCATQLHNRQRLNAILIDKQFFNISGHGKKFI